MTAAIANLLSNNYGLRVFCNVCRRVADIDVDEMAEKYGQNVSVKAIGRKARSAECGGLGGEVQVVAVRW